MSRRKGRVAELETQIRNLKVKQGRILKASKNNHIGLRYWKNNYINLLAGLETLGISLAVVDGVNQVYIDVDNPNIQDTFAQGESDVVEVRTRRY